MKVAFLAAYGKVYIAGMDHGSYFDAAESGGAHADAHLRLRGIGDHLRHLHRSGCWGS